MESSIERSGHDLSIKNASVSGNSSQLSHSHVPTGKNRGNIRDASNHSLQGSLP